MLSAVFPFDSVKARCAVCGELVDGTYRRGKLYYCSADFEITSPEEKVKTAKIKKEEKEIKRFLKNA